MAFAEFITEAPRPQKIIFGVMGLAILVIGGYFLLLSGKMTEVGELRGQKATKEFELGQTRALAANLARFKQEAQALRAWLEAARERLPSEREIPGLYRRVSDLAFQAGLSVSLFQPKAPVGKDFYEEIPITVSAEAGYHELGKFFESVSRLPRIVNLTDLKLTAIARPTGTIRADLILSTYVFRPEGAPAPPPPTGAQR